MTMNRYFIMALIQLEHLPVLYNEIDTTGTGTSII
jgi:hypothetical protein